MRTHAEAQVDRVPWGPGLGNAALAATVAPEGARRPALEREGQQHALSPRAGQRQTETWTQDSRGVGLCAPPVTSRTGSCRPVVGAGRGHRPVLRSLGMCVPPEAAGCSPPSASATAPSLLCRLPGPGTGEAPGEAVWPALRPREAAAGPGPPAPHPGQGHGAGTAPPLPHRDRSGSAQRRKQQTPGAPTKQGLQGQETTASADVRDRREGPLLPAAGTDRGS